MLQLGFGLCIFTGIIWWIILIPLTIYHGYNYYKLRGHIIMQKRYSQITNYEVIIMVIKLFWGIFLFFMVILHGEGSDYAAIFEIPYQLLSFMLLYCWVWRFYMIHYDTQFTLSTVKQDWAIVINKRFKDLKTNWYINNKSKYGNSIWIKRHCIIPLIIIQTSLIVLPIIYFAFIDNKDNEQDSIWHELQLFSSANLCLPFILLLLIYLRTPHFQDQIFVSTELKRIFIILLIKNILTLPIFLYQIIENPAPEIDIICFFLFLNITNGGQWSAILVATYCVNKQVSPIIAKQQYKIMDYHTMSQRRNSASIPYLKITSSSNINKMNDPDNLSNNTFDTGSRGGSPRSGTNYDDIKLIHIIQHYEGFEAFIVHLSYEFCSETILAFIEILQYQQYISLHMKQKSIDVDHIKGRRTNKTEQTNNDNNNNNNDDENSHSTVGPINTSNDYNKSLFERIKLPKQIPNSSIVYDGIDEYLTQNIDENEFINMMKIKAYKLYKKYIGVGDQYQVNISYTTRRRIEKFMKNYDEFLLNDDITLNDLLFLFDKTSEEIYSLMNDSFNRFSSTAEFQKLHQLCSSQSI